MTLSDVAIRPAKLKDAAVLARLHVASWHESYARIVPDSMLKALSIETRTAMWVQILQEPASAGSTVVHLAEINEKLVGFGSCGQQRTEGLKGKGFSGEFSALYVLRAFQGMGCGSRLLQTMSLDLLNRAFTAASLWVLTQNHGARRFYEHRGARVVGEREDPRGDAVLTEIAYGWTDLTPLCPLKRSETKLGG